MMPNRTPAQSLRRQAGMTLAELMVAVALAGLIMTGIFFFSTSTSRTFRLQNEIAQTTDRLNFAMETLKADLRRTSYLTVPNSRLQAWPNQRRVCANPAFAPAGLQAIVAENGGATWQPATQADQVMVGATPDELLLLGAFRSDSQYLVTAAQQGSTALTFDLNGDSLDDAEYALAGAILNVSTPAGGMQFVRAATGSGVVTGGTGLQPRATINTLDPLLGSPGGDLDSFCQFRGEGNAGVAIAPLHYVRYDVREDPDEPSSTILVREELDHANNVLNSYVVARNVIDFQIWFDADTTTIGSAPDIANDGTATDPLTDDDGTMAWTDLNGSATSAPQQARYGYIQLSVRLDTPLPNLQPEPDSVGLRNVVELIEVPDGGGAGVRTGTYTRVLTIRTEVELSNISLADL